VQNPLTPFQVGCNIHPLRNAAHRANQEEMYPNEELLSFVILSGASCKFVFTNQLDFVILNEVKDLKSELCTMPASLDSSLRSE
jgi:hypothetical protein